jgi:hypothetical protein
VAPQVGALLAQVSVPWAPKKDIVVRVLSMADSAAL